MRAFCTVSAPLEVCASSAEQLSPGSRFLALRLLGNQQPKTLYFLVDAKSRVREVYKQTCLHFATQGMLDTELFGLAVLIDGEYMFADPESKLSKYGPKSWRSSHTHGLDANGRPLLELHFRVQFYIESPFMLKDENSKHNYYLQLKYNALQRDIPREYSEQSMILLASLALQADFGDAPHKSTTTTTTITTTTTTTTTNNIGNNNNEKILINNDNDNGKQSSTATTTAINTTSPTNKTSTTISAATTTTTLPKMNKRKSSVNEKVLRLSTYVNSVASTADAKPTTSATPTPTSDISPSPSALSPIRGSLKRGLSAVAITLSATATPTAAALEASLASSSGSSTTSRCMSSETPEADYFRVEDYLPEGLRSAWAVSALRACHRENRGMSTTDAELHYIQQACLVHEGINSHTFRMRLTKSESGPGSSWFVVYAKGIKIINVRANNDAQQPQTTLQGQQQQHQQQQQQTTFLWPNITKLSFERKKFEIRSGDSKVTLYATSDEKNKMLLTLCKETHQFSMKIAARLKEVIKRDEEESSCLHACYIYSRSLHMLYKNKNDQRISVISSTSSNTTSGIVSDRVHSEDELEIMINTPPAPIAAPSTESLALAHLLDRPSVSRQTSSVGQVSLKDLEEQLAALSVCQAQQQRSSGSGGESPTEMKQNSVSYSSSSNSGGSLPTTSSQRHENSSTATDSPSSQHNIGSQCSSTCSTVVVAASTTTDAASNVLNTFTNSQRRNSTSSSLELGFSHTAQNSTLSEAESTCIEHDFISATTHDESESVSGVYTLAHGAPPTETSGVYTMNSSELTGQSSEIAESEKSSHYGIFKPAKNELNETNLGRVTGTCSGSVGSVENADSVDGGNYGRGKRMKNEDFRLRSDSNISTSGSFRGDGSDPTDNKHTLLSAKELTELIVGRGTYPNRKTVSSTLDSDCDYVTLPMPLAGESYIAGHQDTAPTEDQVEDMINDLLPVDPPAPPKRIDSTFTQINNMRMRSPPPYNARHEKTGLCGPPISTIVSSPISHANVPSLNVAEIVVVKSSTPTAVKSVPSPVPAAVAVTTANTPANALLRRRDPPPYPSASKPRPTSLVASPKLASTKSFEPTRVSLPHAIRSEEVPARIITSRPQINILKAHTSLISDSAKPCYSAPAHSSSAVSSNAGSIGSNHLSSHLSQNSNYVSCSQNSLSLGHRNVVMAKSTHIPMVPYHNLHGAHKSMSALHHHHAPPPPPPYPDIKPPPAHTCVLLPVMKQQQYLPPPPPSFPRQPPPPPPNQLAAAVYGKQLELYQQQLYSDVDYVIYPIRDPAVSQQEYLDAKQGSLLAAMAAQTPPPPHPYLAAYHHHHHHHQHTAASAWDTCKAHAIYRSTPYLPLALSAHSRYASTQNLSDTYVQLPSACSPLYSPSMASLCSSFEPPPPPPLHPATLAAAHHNSSSLFARSRSDDNILNSLDAMPKMKRLPPPPPPPYVNRRLKKPPMPTPTEKPPPIPSKPASVLNPSSQMVVSRYQLPPRKPPTLSTNCRSSHNPHMTKTSSGAQWAGERPKQTELGYSPGGSNSLIAQLQASMAAANRRQTILDNKTAATATATNANNAAAAANALDIALLREKSRHLDLPLISALCNDRSLLKQTKVLVNAKQTANSTVMSQTTNTATSTSTTTLSAAGTATTTAVDSTTPATTMSNIRNSIRSCKNSITHATAEANNMSNSTTATTGTTTQITQLVTAVSTVPAATITTTTTSAATTISAITTNNNKINNVVVSKTRKTSNSHRHPNDKLPPLPMQLAEANNYVMDPAAALKHHKSNNGNTTNNNHNNNSNTQS